MIGWRRICIVHRASHALSALRLVRCLSCPSLEAVRLPGMSTKPLIFPIEMHRPELPANQDGVLVRQIDTPWAGDLLDVRINVTRCFVRLRGRVATYHLKQIAQAIVAVEYPAHRVLNHLVVGRDVGDQESLAGKPSQDAR